MSDLARLLDAVAADLDRRGYGAAGIVRQAARQLVVAPVAEDGCRGCGGPLVQSGRGRRRVWCGEPCRRRHRP